MRIHFGSVLALPRELTRRIRSFAPRIRVWIIEAWRKHKGEMLSAALLVLAVGVDVWIEQKTQAENCVPKEERSAISTPLRDFVPTPRIPRSRYVAIISLRPDSEPAEIFNDGCQLKIYLARLITRLAGDHPAVIVMDKYIPGGACGTPDNVTKSLRSAIEKSNTPIVLSLKTEFLDYSERPESEESSCLVLSDNWMLDAPGVSKGLMKVNRNFKRIPLKWDIFAGREEVLHGRIITEFGVAAVAADLYSGGELGIVAFHGQPVRRRGALRDYTKFLVKGEHPFVGGGLIRTSEFRIWSAADILRDSTQDTLDTLRGRIVIIGDFSAANTYQIGPGQEMAGAVLQANYIEALLDFRTFLPFSYGGFSLFYVAWLLVMQRAFWKSKSPELTGLSFLLLLLIVNLIVLKLHVFIGLLKQGATIGAVVVKWIEARGHISTHT
jgi:hypothetical protein